MRLYITLFFIGLAVTVQGQRYKATEGKIKFYSEAPVENITATNTDGTSIYDHSTSEIVFSVPIRSFQFRKALMQEHFNESYLESEKYPNATFKGKVSDFNINGGKQQVKAMGDMTIHGVTRQITVEGTMKPGAGKIHLETVFPIKVEDYDVKIPRLLWQNIAEEVEVTVEFTYKPL